MLRTVVTVCACALVLAGCAVDDDDARLVGPTPSSPAPTSPAPDSPAPDSPAPDSPAPDSPAPEPPTSAEPVRLEVRTVATGLENPLQILASPGGGLIVVEQAGRIRRARGGELTTVLDITDRVRFRGEQGLLAVAFHPDHPSDRRLFLHYSGAPDGRTVLSSMVIRDDGTVDPESETILLERAQPAPNHNGGMLRFGPDGMLYLGLGDGGAAADRFDNGQDTTTLLGGILRMDVDARPGTVTTPPDNPFVGGGGDDLLWQYGLRNPWRFTFDGGSLYVADVGQDAVEELSIVPADAPGLNFGWPILEGSQCFRSDGCDRDGLVLPVAEYTHAETGGCSIIGGEVYHGDALPGLTGHYLYADLCAGLLRSVRHVTGEGVVERRDWTEQVGTLAGPLGFGEDAAGELYVGLQDGRIVMLAPA